MSTFPCTHGGVNCSTCRESEAAKRMRELEDTLRLARDLLGGYVGPSIPNMDGGEYRRYLAARDRIDRVLEGRP